METPKKPPYLPVLVVAVLAMLAAVAMILLNLPMFAAALLGAAIGSAFLAWSMLQKHKNAQAHIQKQRDALCHRYGTEDAASWLAMAQQYLAAWHRYEQTLALHRDQRRELDDRREALQQKAKALSGRSRSQWQEVLSCWASLEDATRSAQQAQEHYSALQSIVKTVPAPVETDELTCSMPRTLQYLSEAANEQQQLQQRLGQYQGQKAALGSPEAMEKELDALNRRIRALEQTNAALERALEALTDARQELQRRFAPRITKGAQALFAQLTSDRYDRFMLTQELSIEVAAQDEDVLHSQQWRSDGTVDQLYLALRLAVAHELIPNAPLILDDALVRFDDSRLATALEILKQEAESKQVILFTCQARERTLLEK